MTSQFSDATPSLTFFDVVVFFSDHVSCWFCNYDNQKYPLSFSQYLETGPVHTGRKLNVNKTFRRRPGPLLNVLSGVNTERKSTHRL